MQVQINKKELHTGPVKQTFRALLRYFTVICCFQVFRVMIKGVVQGAKVVTCHQVDLGLPSSHRKERWVKIISHLYLVPDPYTRDGESSGLIRIF